RGRPEDAAVEPRRVQPGEETRVGAAGVLVVLDAVDAEEGREHRAGAVDGGGDARLVGGGTQALFEAGAETFEKPVRGAVAQRVEGGAAGGHGQRVAAQRARLVHGA